MYIYIYIYIWFRIIWPNGIVNVNQLNSATQLDGASSAAPPACPHLQCLHIAAKVDLSIASVELIADHLR